MLGGRWRPGTSTPFGSSGRIPPAAVDHGGHADSANQGTNLRTVEGGEHRGQPPEIPGQTQLGGRRGAQGYLQPGARHRTVHHPRAR
jgi:hypothetical protein